MGEDREQADSAREKLRKTWEKFDDVRFEVSYRFDQVMRHPVAGKAFEFAVNMLAKRLGTAAAAAHGRRRRATFQASLPSDSPWKIQPGPRSDATGE